MHRTITLSIKETSPNVWRVAYNGYPLGDSRGYAKVQALEEMQKVANRKDDGSWQMMEDGRSRWIDVTYIVEA